MNRSNSFLPSFVLFFTALIFCLSSRIRLKLSGLINPGTGFYEGGGWLVPTFNIVLIVTFLLCFVFYLFRSVDQDYPVYEQGRGLALLAMLTGFSIILYQLEAMQLFGTADINPGVVLDDLPFVITTFLGIVSAWAFVWLGGRGLFGVRGMYGAAIPLVAGVWQMITLVSKYNSYTTLTTISDNLLAALFMLFCSMFLVAHARTLSGLGRKDGRNYAIPTGLCAALCGFLLTVPNWAWLLAKRTREIPAPLLGGFESFFVFCMSLYALCFVISLTKSIKSV